MLNPFVYFCHIYSLIRDALSPNLSGDLANQFISQSFESLEDVVNFVHQLLCAGPCSGQRASSVKTLFLPFLNLQSGGGERGIHWISG